MSSQPIQRVPPSAPPTLSVVKAKPNAAIQKILEDRKDGIKGRMGSTLTAVVTVVTVSILSHRSTWETVLAGFAIIGIRASCYAIADYCAADAELMSMSRED